jgi:hypothetical protein
MDKSKKNKILWAFFVSWSIIVYLASIVYFVPSDYELTYDGGWAAFWSICLLVIIVAVYGVVIETEWFERKNSLQRISWCVGFLVVSFVAIGLAARLPFELEPAQFLGLQIAIFVVSWLGLPVVSSISR